MRERSIRRNRLAYAASVALALVIASVLGLQAQPRPVEAAFPGANGKIAFVEVNDEESDWGLKLVSPNGAGLVTLVRNPGGAATLSDPSVSNDGTRVAFARNREIFKVNVRNRVVTRITDNAWDDGNPTWSPNGARIAFESTRTTGSVTNSDIYVRDSDGGGSTANLTNTPDENEHAPTWSPDGTEIAFHTRESGEVFVLNLETGQRRNVTNDGDTMTDQNPNWSPDGTRIVFNSYDERYCYIHTVDASDGSERRLLIRAFCDISFGSGAFLLEPSYSPDGAQVAYQRIEVDYVYGRPQIYRMTSSTGGNRRLVYNAYNSGGGYPYSEFVELDSPDWGQRVQP